MLDEEITERIHQLELTGPPSASLPEDLVNFPHSAEAVELCFDSNLRVTLQKVFKPLELVFVLYLTNQNQANASIHDVSSVLEPPSNLIASFDSSTSNKLQDESIGPLEWVRISCLCSISNSLLVKTCSLPLFSYAYRVINSCSNGFQLSVESNEASITLVLVLVLLWFKID